MKTAISLPDEVYVAAEKVIRRKHVSRSEFYATAIRWYVEKESKVGITEQLNKIYGNIIADESPNDSAIADLPRNDWT
jgi:metal-responsive CopG/Arc/MetJ family transcriptional regulator